MNNKTVNELINEKSPYLLQHAHNPVNWYPWGSKAFELARQLDRPVFLSIGYSTCHWCHVMAHESFEDPEVAELLNDHFICIKVDREERPDVDSVYMKVCQALTGAGGWPLTIMMDAEQKPFFAATYIPKRSTYAAAGLMDLLPAVAERWTHDRDSLKLAGDRIYDFLNQEQSPPAAKSSPKEMIRSAFMQLRSRFDEINGGFGSAPKFPMPHQLLFLLRYHQLEGQPYACCMVIKTLEQMYRGGIFDHIGGGFSRYSTDPYWLVPHFEKMLYDNALLGLVYSEAYAVTQDVLFKDIACRCFDYILKEMKDQAGGFCSAQDADSEGIEGSYYTFSPEEILSATSTETGQEFCRRYGITEKGNFEGKSIPNLLDQPAYRSAGDGMEAVINTLYQYRLERTKLHKDDKELASWNCLMIAALARSCVLLGKDEYLSEAKCAQSVFEKHFSAADGSLKLRWREGEAAFDGHLDDYAFYAWALLELYRVTYNVKYLSKAIGTMELTIRKFYDEKGGFYLYAGDTEQLISRPKDTYDGAMPSGNSVCALVLGRLWKLTGDNKWHGIFRKHMDYLYKSMGEYPSGAAFALLAGMEDSYPSRELVCVGLQNDMEKELKDLHLPSIPNIHVIMKTRDNADELAAAVPYTKEYPLPGEEEGNMYYLCSSGACMQPCGIETLRKII